MSTILKPSFGGKEILCFFQFQFLAVFSIEKVRIFDVIHFILYSIHRHSTASAIIIHCYTNENCSFVGFSFAICVLY